MAASTIHPARLFTQKWDAFNDSERASLTTLGFTEALWFEVVEHCDYNQLPQSFRGVWNQLSQEHWTAAARLGFTEAAWNREVRMRVDLLSSPLISTEFSRLARAHGIIDVETVATLISEARRGPRTGISWGVHTQPQKRALLYILSVYSHRFTNAAREAVYVDMMHSGMIDRMWSGNTVMGWKSNVEPEPTGWFRTQTVEGLSSCVTNDAGLLTPLTVRDVVRVHSAAEIQAVLAEAALMGYRVSIAAVRHSMGGQSSGAGTINIDVLGMKGLSYDPQTQWVCAESGCTWEDVKRFLRQHRRTISVMQTSEIFSVGGSVSVNCHGRTAGAPPIISTIMQLEVVLHDGKIVLCSRTENEELFRHVCGGYGLFGVVVRAWLITVPNVLCQTSHIMCETVEEFCERYQAAFRDRANVCVYGRLNPTMDGTGYVNVLTQIGEAQEDIDAEADEYGTMGSMMRLGFFYSKKSRALLATRWAAELKVLRPSTGPRSAFMGGSSDFLRHYRSEDGKKADILHEYFIPWAQVPAWLAAVRELALAGSPTSLNITARHVDVDRDSALPYARQDMLAFVLIFNVAMNGQALAQQAEYVRQMVDIALNLGGCFYLPYQQHYTRAQVMRGYPMMNDFLAVKKKYDPMGRFTNNLYEFLSAGANVDVDPSESSFSGWGVDDPDVVGTIVDESLNTIEDVVTTSFNSFSSVFSFSST